MVTFTSRAALYYSVVTIPSRRHPSEGFFSPLCCFARRIALRRLFLSVQVKLVEDRLGRTLDPVSVGVPSAHGVGHTHLLLALVVWPMTTHPVRDGAPLLLLKRHLQHLGVHYVFLHVLRAFFLLT